MQCRASRVHATGELPKPKGSGLLCNTLLRKCSGVIGSGKE